MADLKARFSSEQDTISKLNAQLEDFIETKNEAETAMLQQFMELLNEKKRKIRDQSRLLAGVKVDRTTGMIPSKSSYTSDLPWRSIRRAIEQSYHKDTESWCVTDIKKKSTGTKSRTRSRARLRQRPNGD